MLPRARTAETYLAGLGASGALIAGVVVAFLILVGTVSFDSWPRGNSLFSSGADEVAIDEGGAPAAPVTQTPVAGSAVRALLARAASGGRGTSGGDGGQNGQNGQGEGPTPGQNPPSGSIPVDGGNQPQPKEPPSSQGGADTLLQNVTSAVDSTVQHTTSGLTDTVNNTVNGLSDTVGGLLGGNK